MNSYQALPVFPHLLDLLHAIRDDEIRLTLAGGLGLLLKRDEVVRRIEAGERTLRPSFPTARATSDMDQFLHASLFADPAQEARLRHVLCEQLKYQPTAHYYQFRKAVPHPSSSDPVEIKIDLMAKGPEAADLARVKRDGVRVATTRTRPAEQAIHGHHTPEAFAVDRLPMVLRVEGRRSSGETCTVDVWLPHPFASLMMKLEAAREHADRPVHERKARGGKHAYDVYLLLAMMMENEWQEACTMAHEEYVDQPIVRGLRASLEQLFGADEAQGCQDILVNHREAGGDVDIELPWMRSVLRELLGVR